MKPNVILRCLSIRSATVSLLLGAFLSALAWGQAPQGKVVASCSFDGPYAKNAQGDLIQKGCTNNYSWGKKDMKLGPDKVNAFKGTAQRIETRGLSNGAVQFFCCTDSLAVKKDRYYRVSFYMRATPGIGEISVLVRKIGYPWSTLVRGERITPDDKWRAYSFTSKGELDEAKDLGVMFQTGFMGTFWIDELKVEEFEQDPRPEPEGPAQAPRGNLFPRCSFEGLRDHLWTSGTYGDAFVQWEDPQHFRAPGGKAGRFSLGVPGAPLNFTSSYLLPVVPGHRYTFSAWMRSEAKESRCRFGLDGVERPGAKVRGLGGKGLKLTDEWQRFELTTKDPVPDDVHFVFVTLTSPDKGNFFADAFQLEVGDKASPFKPAHAFELYVSLDRPEQHVSFWGKPVNLRLLAASAESSDSHDRVPVDLVVTAFPDREVLRQRIELPLNEDTAQVIDSKLNGLFRITLRAADPKLAAESELVMARLPEPLAVPPEDSYFGTHATIRPYFVEYARNIGMKWTRFHDASQITKWSGAEPEQGKFVWYDEQVKGVRDAGLQILALPDRAPRWALTSADNSASFDVDAFARHCETVAAHYRGLIDYWEVWNEPYMAPFFKGGPEQFGRVFDAGVAALRKGNPDARVAGPCAELSGVGFAQKLAAASKARPDIFSFHGYFMNLTGGGTTSFAEELKALVEAFGMKPDVPRWNTEGALGLVGSNCFYSFLADPRINDWAAAFGSRVWLSTSSSGIGKMFIYTLHQTDTIRYHGGLKMLINYDRSITPSAVATAVTAHCMDGLKPAPCHAPRKGVAQYAFAGQGRAMWAAFEDPNSTTPTFLDLEKLPANFAVMDVMGNDPRADSVKRWRLGQQPLFVCAQGVDVADLSKKCFDALGN